MPFGAKKMSPFSGLKALIGWNGYQQRFLHGAYQFFVTFYGFPVFITT
jgi:hypothetical protein